tara:strand:+ start:3078 stop:3290 length:213 start_codon:yes stop_codon:yes gene_type:complete
MKLYIKTGLISAFVLLASNISYAEEKKDCSDLKKLSKEYLACTAKKLGKSFKIDGKSAGEVKEEIKNLKN